MASSKPYKSKMIPAAKGIGKTGLTARMRAWMQAREGPPGKRRFFMRELCAALEIPPGQEKENVRSAMKDFLARGEVIFRVNQKRNRRHFSYNQSWRKTQKGELKKKMFKAMYVLGNFAMSDVRRLAHVADKHWISRIIRSLLAQGYLQQISRRRCVHGYGAEKVYRIIDRDKFKLELM